MKNIESAYLSDVGRVRHNNQDYLAVSEPTESQDTDCLYVLCDGMGGYKGGEVASQLVTTEIIKRYRSIPKEDGNIQEALTISINQAYKALKAAAAKQNDLNHMGTTLVMAVIREDRFHLVNVGDCRAYVLRNNKLIQITEDHSRVEELIRNGSIKRKKAKKINQNVITRSISAAGNAPQMDFFTRELRDKDILLLCSDGVWKQVRQKEIARILRSSSPESATKKLIEASNRAGGIDNSSVIVIYARAGDKVKADKKPHKGIRNPLFITLMVTITLAVLILGAMSIFLLR